MITKKNIIVTAIIELHYDDVYVDLTNPSAMRDLVELTDPSDYIVESYNITAVENA